MTPVDGQLWPRSTSDVDFFLQRRSSYCTTMPELLAQTTMTINTGSAYGVATFSDITNTFTTIWFLTGSTAPSGGTDLKLCVWDANGALLSSTANISATVTAANQLVSAALSPSISLTQYQQIYLGISFVGTSIQFRGASGVSVMSSARGLRAFILCRSSSGWAGGTAPALTTSGSGILPWLELS